jgi:hypothetical protein
VGDGEGGEGGEGEPPPPEPGEPPPPESGGPQSQPPPPSSQSLDQVDLDKVLEQLDKNEGNPQLEKLLRSLKTVPRMEDY